MTNARHGPKDEAPLSNAPGPDSKTRRHRRFFFLVFLSFL